MISFPQTVPIPAAQARQNAANINDPINYNLLLALNALIAAASNLGMYSINYNVQQLNQTIINQLTSVGYIVTDNTFYPAVPTLYTYTISWTQLNYPPSGQPA